MIASQLEALVIEAVTHAQAHGAREDDRIEFKRSWPGLEKGRQLAAAANGAGGDWLIYVIGVDEKDGSVHPTNATDPATWWAQMEASFDEVAPELVRHLNVQVSSSDSVVVLQFRTDRSPYVVKVANGGATEREIPIRVGTRTRSAHRHELIRLMLPSVSVPTVEPLSAVVTAGRPPYTGGNADLITRVDLSCDVYFEHLGPSRAFLPRHLATATLLGGDFRGFTNVHYPRVTTPLDASFGVSLREDGIELSGPGRAHLYASFDIPRERHEEFARVDEWKVRLDFGVAGTDRATVLELTAGGRVEEAERIVSADQDSQTKYLWSVRQRRP